MLEVEQDKKMKRGCHHPQQILLSVDYILSVGSTKRNKITGYLWDKTFIINIIYSTIQVYEGSQVTDKWMWQEFKA